MCTTVEDLRKLIEERIAPPGYQAEWDNTGMNLNLRQADVTGVLVCLDVTKEIIAEAKEKGCGLIVAHHPLLFRPVKSVDMADYAGGCLAVLIQKNISLYCAHTSMDAVPHGINGWLADALDLGNRSFLAEETRESYYKISVTVPRGGDARRVKDALSHAGAGKLGDYSHCNFSVDGVGEFLPEDGANPRIGARGTLESVEETWVQALVSGADLKPALAALREAHPYEEPAIDVFPLANEMAPVAGIGIVGDLSRPVKAAGVLDRLKTALELDVVRFHGNLDRQVSRVAVCGGGGGDLIPLAARAGAQLFVTGEVKHSQYLAAGLMVAEAGHYDTEKCFCTAMAHSLQKALDDVQYNVAVCISERMERPYVNY